MAPSISTTTISPGTRRRPRTTLTPAGVPVAMTSSGSNVTISLTASIRRQTSSRHEGRAAVRVSGLSRTTHRLSYSLPATTGASRNSIAELELYPSLVALTALPDAGPSSARLHRESIGQVNESISAEANDTVPIRPAARSYEGSGRPVARRRVHAGAGENDHLALWHLCFEHVERCVAHQRILPPACGARQPVRGACRALSSPQRPAEASPPCPLPRAPRTWARLRQAA
jgi:hypothetical protein